MIARLRLWSGIVLFAYVTVHLLNHVVVLASVQAADAVMRVVAALWHSLPGTVLLYGAFFLHVALTLWALFRRRSLRLTRWEWAQLGLGLAIVPLGMTHFVGTRGAHELFDVNATYLWVLLPMALDPWAAARQTGLLLVVWAHGCIGLHFYWRLKPWYFGALPALYGAALVIPALALAGVGTGVGKVIELREDAERFRAAFSTTNPPPREAVDRIYALSDAFKLAAAALVIGVFGARRVRTWAARRGGEVRLSYASGRNVVAHPGLTVLDISRLNGIPHASVCGGRGRCSTCRVRIVGPDSAALPPPDAAELRVLSRFGAPANVRLACQLRPPPGEYRVAPLLPAGAQPSDAYSGTKLSLGGERMIAVMFVDLRGFTAFSEKRLPYDVVFILNRYFRAVGQAIEDAGGRVDKFIGDGVMALFGLDVDGARAARQSLDAARRIALAIGDFNESLTGEIDEPLRIGIGIHAGPAIVGDLGHGRATTLTAIGDTVNTASRLEAQSKDFAAQLVVSQDLLDLAGVKLDVGERHEVEVRGREERLRVHVVKEAALLAET
jgi:adenylate cyclase